ncbi:MAG TPA: alpha/beta hydrolase [Clostridia bacterium]
MKIIEIPFTSDRRVRLTGYIQEPSPVMQNVAKKPAVLIFPGGAYMHVSDREAEPIALAYAAEGFQTFVLYYSVGEFAHGFQPLSEAEKALRMIRDNSEEWHVYPDKIAVCGFSAGGHLACALGLMGKERPNAMILCYPAIDFGKVESGHDVKDRILRNLLGKENYTQDEVDKLNLHLQVKSDAPPAFIWHTFEDNVVDVTNTAKLAMAMAENYIPFEYHLFQEGKHGLSLAKHHTASGRSANVNPTAAKWLDMSVDWLHRRFGYPAVDD